MARYPYMLGTGIEFETHSPSVDPRTSGNPPSRLVKPSREHCSITNCEQPVVSSLDREALCRTHFISVCYTRLDQYNEIRWGHALSTQEAETMRRFIHVCLLQADEIERATENLDNLERAKLLLIILLSIELGRHLRRNPRKWL